MNEALKPCPWCHGNNIGFSNKTTSRYKRHVSMFCKDCNSYGARVLIQVPKEAFYSGTHYSRSAIEMLGYIEAVTAWNRRTPATLPTVEELFAMLDSGLGQDYGDTWSSVMAKAAAKLTQDYLTRRMGGES